MSHRHTIAPGECIATIAFENGFFPGTLWDAAENAELRAKRREGYVLEPGDVLFVPDLQPQESSAATGKRHVFRRRGVPERLNLVLRDALGKARANLPYTLTLDGVPRTGATDGEGAIRVFISPDTWHGTLELSSGETFALKLGHLAPADGVVGLQQRLKNLGHDIGADQAGEFGPHTRDALAAFLRSQGRTAPATWDDAAITEAAALLRDRHGA